MTRSNLLPPHNGDIYTHAEAVAAFDCWLTEQEQIRRQGERLVAVNFDSNGRITSLKRCDKPAAFKRIPKSA